MITDTNLGTDTKQRPDSDLDYYQEPEQPNIKLVKYEPYFDTITLPTLITSTTPIPLIMMSTTQTTTQTNMTRVQPTGTPAGPPAAPPPPLPPSPGGPLSPGPPPTPGPGQIILAPPPLIAGV